MALIPASPCWDTADLLGIFDLEGTMLVLNRTWRRVLGHDCEELAGLPFTAVAHPEDVDRLSGGFHRHVLAGERHAAPVVVRMRCADGSFRWVEWSATILRNEGAVLATGRDVTDRRAAEAEFRLLAENVGDMISRHAPDGTYL